MTTSMIDQFVTDVTLIVDNVEYASEQVNNAVQEALSALPDEADEYDRIAAAGEAVEEIVYDLVAGEISDDSSFTGLLMAQFLGVGGDGWRKVGKTYL